MLVFVASCSGDVLAVGVVVVVRDVGVVDACSVVALILAGYVDPAREID